MIGKREGRECASKPTIARIGLQCAAAETGDRPFTAAASARTRPHGKTTRKIWLCSGVLCRRAGDESARRQQTATGRRTGGRWNAPFVGARFGLTDSRGRGCFRLSLPREEIAKSTARSLRGRKVGTSGCRQTRSSAYVRSPVVMGIAKGGRTRRLMLKLPRNLAVGNTPRGHSLGRCRVKRQDCISRDRTAIRHRGGQIGNLNAGRALRAARNK